MAWSTIGLVGSAARTWAAASFCGYQGTWCGRYEAGRRGGRLFRTAEADHNLDRDDFRRGADGAGSRHLQATFAPDAQECVGNDWVALTSATTGRRIFAG